MEPSIFTRIIRGEIPAHKIYEDDRVIAFLDIHPISEGHTLVVPKKQVSFVWDLDEEDYAYLMSVARKIALHLRQKMNVPYVGEQIIGYDVPHAHVHLVPFSTPSEFHFVPDPNAEPNHEALAAIADLLSL